MVALPMGLFMNGVQVDSRVMTQRAMQISWPRQPQAKSFHPRLALLRSGVQAGCDDGSASRPNRSWEHPGQGR